MNTKTYRIAFSGVFDLANYGDHLFPLVFAAEMKKMKIDIELYLFSPLECRQAFYPNVEVYALDDLEKKHLEEHFDAIIVAGGELIHFNESPQKLKIGAEKFETYIISKTWIIPAIVACKYNIKLLWNLPGVPYHFEPSFSHLVKGLCSCVDYLSVRNEFSKEVLIEECCIESGKISVFPDSAFRISHIMNKSKLDEIRKNISEIKGKYIVFHSNRHIPKDEIPVVINCLDQLKEEGYQIVLLPLAYTHDDEAILSEINKMAHHQYVLIDHILSVEEMISILAECELYIGVSFHGAITAATYKRKAIAYDFMNNHKTKDLFTTMKQEAYYCTQAGRLPQLIHQIMTDEFCINSDEIQKRLDVHFNNIKHVLCENKAIEKGIGEITREYIAGIREFVEWNIQNINVKEKEQYIDKLEDGIKWHWDMEAQKDARITELEDGIKWHEDMEEEKDKIITELKKKIEESELKKNELQVKIFHMENSLSWKITKWLRNQNN